MFYDVLLIKTVVGWNMTLPYKHDLEPFSNSEHAGGLQKLDLSKFLPPKELVTIDILKNNKLSSK